MTAQTPFQKEFKVNDEFYSGKQIKDTIAKLCMQTKDRNKRDCYELVYIPSPSYKEKKFADKDFLLVEDLDRIIIDLDLFFGSQLVAYKNLGFRLFEPMTNAMTEFEATDLGYICIKQG